MDTPQGSWKLHFAGIESTDIEGINLMLGGTTVEEYLTEKKFIRREEKLPLVPLPDRRELERRKTPVHYGRAVRSRTRC
jgi:hypothetical protein